MKRKRVFVRIQRFLVIGRVVKRAVRRVQRDDDEKRLGRTPHPLERLLHRRRRVRRSLPLDDVAAVHGVPRPAMVVRAPPDDGAVEAEQKRVAAVFDAAVGLAAGNGDVAAEVPLPEVAGGVSRVLERPRDRSAVPLALGQVDAIGERHVVGDEPLLVRPPPRHQHRPIRRAQRMVHVVPVERDPFARELLEMRRLHRRGLRERHRSPSVGVAHDVDDVGANRLGLRRWGTRRHREHCDRNSAPHQSRIYHAGGI